MTLFVRLLIAGVTMGILDFIWLGFAAKKLYADEMGSLLLDKFNMAPALLFYAIYIVGVVVFVINPALAKSSLAHAAGYGALFGLVAYATYDLTSLAVIKGFSLKVTVIDMIWGALLTAVVSVVTYVAVKQWLH